MYNTKTKTFEEILNDVEDPSIKELIKSKIHKLSEISKEISDIYDNSHSFPSAKSKSWSKAESSVELIEDIENLLLSSSIRIEFLELFSILKDANIIIYRKD